jgi:TRAP-type C4-dicarboxylate transport system substrate-binding protein
MQKGTIDGTFQGYRFIADFRTEQMDRSVTELGISSIIFAMVMNKKKYDSLRMT